jgi:hypothetical protein
MCLLAGRHGCRAAIDIFVQIGFLSWSVWRPSSIMIVEFAKQLQDGQTGARPTGIQRLRRS